MNLTRHLILPLVGALALPMLVSAQTTSTPPASTATTTRPPTDTTPTTAEAGRFNDLRTAPSAVAGPVQTATSLADSIRQGVVVPATAVRPLTTAVSTATTAIVQDGQAVRTDVLSQRQAALTRLRLAQTEQDRRRVIDELRTQAGQRMDEQRETARLVRDRLRELRDLTTISRPPGS